jgi:hypothetical protein
LTVGTLNLQAGTYGINTNGAGNVLIANVVNDGGAAVTINKSGDEFLSWITPPRRSCKTWAPLLT